MDCIGRTWLFLSHWDCIVIPWGHLWLLARRTGLSVPSLLHVYVLHREGMSGALTCIWCVKMYLCLSYLPLPCLFWRGNTLCPPSLSCEQTQLNPLLDLFTNQRDGNIIVLMLSTGLFLWGCCNKTSHSLKVYSFWKLKAAELTSGQAAVCASAGQMDGRGRGFWGPTL